MSTNSEDTWQQLALQIAELGLKLDKMDKALEGLAQYCMNMFANMVATLAGDALSSLVAMIPYVGPSLAPLVRSITVSYIQGTFKTYNGYII